METDLLVLVVYDQTLYLVLSVIALLLNIVLLNSWLRSWHTWSSTKKLVITQVIFLIFTFFRTVILPLEAFPLTLLLSLLLVVLNLIIWPTINALETRKCHPRRCFAMLIIVAIAVLSMALLSPVLYVVYKPPQTTWTETSDLYFPRRGVYLVSVYILIFILLPAIGIITCFLSFLFHTVVTSDNDTMAVRTKVIPPEFVNIFFSILSFVILLCVYELILKPDSNNDILSYICNKVMPIFWILVLGGFPLFDLIRSSWHGFKELKEQGSETT